MIDTTHKLPVTRQAELLDLSRSNVYYLPRPVSAADLGLMRRIDELHLNFPFAGARMLRDMLKLEGFEVGRKHVRTLMERMGIAAIYRKRNTSAPHPEHQIYPYLLRNLTIERPNQVWASDITYIPMRRGFVYLVAIIDWATRRVLAHRVSISMTTDFCVEALEEAIAKYGTPEIFNTDQGSQFTSDDVHQGSQSPRHQDQHGRQGTLDRQRVRRAAVEEREVRARLPACLRERRRGQAATDELLHFLQYPSPSLLAGRNDAGHGILRQAGDTNAQHDVESRYPLPTPRMINNRRNFT